MEPDTGDRGGRHAPRLTLAASPSSRAIVVGYLAVGAAWILVSGQVAAALIADERTLADVETVKGWLFILVTGMVLGALLTRRDITIQRAADAVRRHEARYREIVETTNDGVVVVDPAGTIAFANEHVAAMLGWTVVEMLGRPVFDLLPPEERLRLAEVFDRTSRWEAGERDVRLLRRDGTTIWTRQRVNRLHDESGAFEGTLALVTDVTERLAQEATLAFQATVLEHVRDAVIVVDPAGRLVLWSAGAAVLFGIPAADATGRTLAEVAAGIDIAPPLPAELATAIGSTADHRVRRAGGSDAWFNARTSEVTDASGVHIATMLVARDVTDRIRAEAAALASEQRFRAFMSHGPFEAFMKDADGRYVYANPAFLERNETRFAAGWLGRSDDELWEAGEASANVAEDAEVVARGEPREFVKRVPSELGDRTLIVYKFPIHDADGQPLLGGVRIDVTEQERSRDELARLVAAIEQAADTIMVTDAAERILYANEALERASGYDRNELIGQRPAILRSGEHSDDYYEEMRRAIGEGRTWSGDIVDRRRDGSLYELNTAISPVVDDDGRLVGWVQVGRDVTRERQLEVQLRQAQKMEAVGRLAGGIAHDFNNLLTAIGGYAELLLEELPPDEQAVDDATEIVRATDRAAQLTRQLLAFGRRQVLKLEVVDLNTVIRGVVPMLRRLIGEDVALVTDLGPDLGLVRADPGQIEQVLVNLAINARDAMPGGGRLTVATTNGDADGTQRTKLRAEARSSYRGRGPDAGRTADVGTAGATAARATVAGSTAAGDVVLTVSDTGVGIDQEALRHIFEPFYTTKKDGHGTGLGLATVYGIVQQSGGSIEVESRPGDGAAFRIRLPRLSDADRNESEHTRDDRRPQLGWERILLVEDEPAVRRLARAALERRGYVVTVAASPDEALALSAAEIDSIDLLVTDVVMPGMNGFQMVERLRSERPDMPVLYTSGYAEEALVRPGVLDPSVNFLPKPFGPDALVARVRAVLDAAGSPVAGREAGGPLPG